MTEAAVIPAPPHQEPEDSAFPDSELEQYAVAKRLAALFRLRDVYYRLFREIYGRYASVAGAVAREHAPDSPWIADSVRASVLRVGARQVWAEVRISTEVEDRFFTIWSGANILGCLVAAGLYFVDHSFWSALGYLAIVVLTSAVAAFVAFLCTEIRFPATRPWRRTVGMIGLIAMLAGAWLIGRWQSFWGAAFFAGITVAVAVLFLLGLIGYAASLAVSIMFRRCWNRLTADEIVETLASTCWALRQVNEQEFRAWTATQLEHVAECVEHRLPAYLTISFTGPSTLALLSGVQSTFNEMSAELRRVAREYFLPKSTTIQSTRDEVAQRMVAAVQGNWGEWNRTSADDEPNIRWRPWLVTTLRAIFGLLPTAIVIAGSLYLYQTNPASPLLKAEVIGPVLVAAISFLTTVLLSGGRSEGPGPTGEHRPTSRFHRPGR
jgi:hypothetical protein